MPTACPRCEIDLIERTNNMDGRKFFGCPNFPKCRYTVTPKEEAEPPVWNLDFLCCPFDIEPLIEKWTPIRGRFLVCEVCDYIAPPMG